MNWNLLKNSLLVSATATLLALFLGMAAALWLAGLKAPRRRWWLALPVAALALPPFLVTDCWVTLLGQTGLLRRWIPFDIYSIGGAAWILALMLWPVSAFAILAAWARVEPCLIESDGVLTGWHLARWVLWPAAAPAAGQACILTFVLALNNFAVPAILQVKVFPAEVWVRFSANYDHWAALALSVPMVLAPLLLLAAVKLPRVSLSWLENQGVPACLRARLGARWFLGAGVLACMIAGLAVVLPLGRLAFSQETWSAMPGVLLTGRTALAGSFVSAAATATVTLALGLLTWRLRAGMVFWLAFLVPGVVLGVALIALLNRPPFVAIYQSAAVVAVAFVLRYFALAWTGAAHARRQVDADLTDAARLEGASCWQMFRHVHWPQMAPQLAATWHVIYLLCLWDIETLVLIVPPGVETLALRAFNLLHYGHNAQVNALCVLLFVLAVLPLCGWRLWTAGYRRHPAGGPFGFPTRPLYPRACGFPTAHKVGRAVPRPPLDRNPRYPGKPGKSALQRLWAGGSSGAAAMLICLFAAGCSRSPSTGEPVQSQLFSHAVVVGERGTAPGQFVKPRSVAVDDQDNLYVVDMTGRLQKFSPDGAFLASRQFPEIERGKPKGMAWKHPGELIVVEPHYSRVNHFAPNLSPRSQWGAQGTNTGRLSFPRAVAANSKGELAVSEYGPVERVQWFTPDGSRCLGALGAPGSQPGLFSRVEGLCFDAGDRLYVADSCNHRIQVFSPGRALLRTYGKPGSGPGGMSYPYDIKVDSMGRQFVCEFGNSRIQVFDAQDRPLETIGSPGTEPGQLNNPWAVALDSMGNLYVADGGNNRVQKLIRRQPLAPSAAARQTASAGSVEPH